MSRKIRAVLCTLALLLPLGHWTRTARAQSASLYGYPADRQPLTLSNVSWTFQEVEPPRELQINDIITVLVDEKARTFSQGDLQRRRNAVLEAVLQNWIRLDGLDIKIAPQTQGNPIVGGILNSQFRAQNTLDSRDNLQMRIAATIVDIRPNGNLVIEARKEVRNNEERWQYSLTGIVRREDVLPNNSITSEDVAELRIDKREEGQIRDGYKRSWLMKLMDRYAPW